MDKKKPSQLSREDTDAWFDAKIARNAERRAVPATAESIGASLAGVSAGVAQARTRAFPKIPAVIGAVMLGGAVVLSLTATSTASGIEAEREAVAVEIEMAQGELDAVAAGADVPVDDATVAMRKTFDAAREDARQVASLQQEYAALVHNAHADTSSIEVPAAALEAVRAQQSKLEGFFTSESLIARDDVALSETQIDPRYPWYIGYKSDGTTVVDPSTSRWEASSVMPTEENGQLQATWLNRTSSGKLLAWATATYFTDRGAFGSLTVGTTTQGTAGAGLEG